MSPAVITSAGTSVGHAGHMADFFTMAVRTGADGMGGISLLLVDAKSEGLKVRKMATQFDTSHSTTFLTLDDVRVPVENLIGQVLALSFCFRWRVRTEGWRRERAGGTCPV